MWFLIGVVVAHVLTANDSLTYFFRAAGNRDTDDAGGCF